jgi:hypothetical protein
MCLLQRLRVERKFRDTKFRTFAKFRRNFSEFRIAKLRKILYREI